MRLPVIVQQNVGGFKIAVNDAAVVQELNGIRQGCDTLGCFGKRNGITLGVAVDFRKRLSRNQIHHKVGGSLMLTDSVHGDDMGMPKTSGRACLLLKSGTFIIR